MLQASFGAASQISVIKYWNHSNAIRVDCLLLLLALPSTLKVVLINLSIKGSFPSKKNKNKCKK